MIGESNLRITEEQAPSLNRRLRDLRQIATKFQHTRMSPLQICASIIGQRLADREARAFFSNLPHEERHYWIASLYALLMPKARRRELAAYFTPPYLANYAIDALEEAGVQLGHQRILDPASGGAAFLVPVAARIAARCRQQGASAKTIMQKIKTSLRGVEIDPGLASLSHALLKDLFQAEIAASGLMLDNLIERANTLELNRPDSLYDAVIGNPPYGRILRPSAYLLERYRSVISDGYVNLYSLFVEQSLQWVRPGGVICLVIPVSFIGGPYFAALRKRILESASVLRLDLIDKRSDVFMDVLYDLCVLVLRRNEAPTTRPKAKSSLILLGEPCRDLGSVELPDEADGRAWALPDSEDETELFQPGLVTLQDYGYQVKTGYFVWNREQHRYRVGNKPRPTEVPLFWAHNIRANKKCVPEDGGDGKIGFAKIPASSGAIIRSDAVILQRTSNRRQKRRLIGGMIRFLEVIGGRGFVTENHTIVIIPDSAKAQLLPLDVVCRLLNTGAVDGRFRRISGSVSVSTKALRDLPLPVAPDVLRFFDGQDDEIAADQAYAASLARVETSADETRQHVSKGRKRS